jgi:folate-binding protein YgfZ
VQILDLAPVSDNLQLTQVQAPRLAGHQVITLQGPDAVAFAQSQFANNVTILAAGNWQWNTWLSAKGRVITIFMLCRVEEQRLLMILADGGAEVIATQLRRFVFRRKLHIDVSSDLAVSATFSASPMDGSAIARGHETFTFDLGSSTNPRSLQLHESISTAADPQFESQWRQTDLRMGLPRLEPAQQELWTPQQLGLDRLKAYSVNKGCYPGQEIVARTHFLGKAKRCTQLLQVPDGSVAGDPVHDAYGANIGTLVSVAGKLALAVLPIETNTAALTVHSAELQPLPFDDGLAR